jgi:glycerophosphoryl diester phosphodiesterase
VHLHTTRVETTPCNKYIKDLTFDQVRSLDCGSLTLPQFPGQAASPGAKMPTLAEVFALADSYRASQVRFNIETKVEAGAPQETAPREQFVDVALREIKAANMQQRVSIESFDWGALRLVQQRDPQIRTVALTNRDFLQAGQPGSSPWLGGIDADDFGGGPCRCGLPPRLRRHFPRARHAPERRRD